MKIKNESGIALILVVSIMAVLASIAASFSYSMIMDQRAAANYMNGIKADYVARAGIRHAIGVLKMDGDVSNQAGYCPYEGYDWYGDDWGYDSTLFGINSTIASEFAKLTADSCVNNDDNIECSNLGGTMPAGSDSRWIYMTDSQGSLIGRYAVLVLDESGKVNINTAGAWEDAPGNEGWTTGEVNLTRILEIANVDEHLSKARDIQSKRYGTDGCAGRSGIDDNHDSVVLNNDGIDNDGSGSADDGDEGVDDSAEFYIASPYTDSNNLSADTPYLTPAEVVSLAGITGGDYDDFDSYITTFSSDKNLTDSGLARLNINAVSSAMELYGSDPNEVSGLRDACKYREGPNAYTTKELAQMAVNIIDYRDYNHASTRIDVEEVTLRGVEGIRINEIMVRPVFRKEAPGPPADEWNDNGLGTGADDGWTYTTLWTSNLPVAPLNVDSGIWSWSGITPGTYKVYVYGTAATNVNCSVYPDEIGGWSASGAQSLDDPDIGDTVIITDGTFKLNIETDIAGDTWYRIELSQSPDCEYVEIVNISSNPIDISGWQLEFPNGEKGTIQSASIGAGDYAVLAMDKDDLHSGAAGLDNNGISISGTWSGKGDFDINKVYQLSFSNKLDDDILCDTILVDTPPLRLYDRKKGLREDFTTGLSIPAAHPDHIVDQVLYNTTLVHDINCDYLSLERDDPTFMGLYAATSIDSLNDSGIFDSWLICTGPHRGTPTYKNNELTASKVPGTDVKVKNYPFANIGEVADVSFSAEEWVNIGNSSHGENIIKNIADRITITGKRLDAEFADYTGDSTGIKNWGDPLALGSPEKISDLSGEIRRKFGKDSINGELYWFRASDFASAQEDTWTWYTTRDRFEEDTYIMYVYGREGGAMTVRVGADTPVYIRPSTDYGARFGQVVVSDTALSIAIQADASSADSVFFDYILLTPASKTYGRLNINTASAPVLRTLRGLYGTGAKANAIVAYRNTKPFSSIGEILDVTDIGIATFKPFSNLITTKSNVFKIICTGQSILDKNGNGTFDTDDEVLGERKITVIYER